MLEIGIRTNPSVDSLLTQKQRNDGVQQKNFVSLGEFKYMRAEGSALAFCSKIKDGVNGVISLVGGEYKKALELQDEQKLRFWDRGLKPLFPRSGLIF